MNGKTYSHDCIQPPTTLPWYSVTLPFPTCESLWLSESQFIDISWVTTRTTRPLCLLSSPPLVPTSFSTPSYMHPEHTAKMYEMDPAPKNKCSPNKVKVDTTHPQTDLDVQLKSKLKAFCQDLHAEWWKDTQDCFLGPQIFLNLDQIHHLCHHCGK